MKMSHRQSNCNRPRAEIAEQLGQSNGKLISSVRLADLGWILSPGIFALPLFTIDLAQAKCL